MEELHNKIVTMKASTVQEENSADSEAARLQQQVALLQAHSAACKTHRDRSHNVFC